MYVWTDGWMDGLVGEWMKVGMDGWIDGFVLISNYKNAQRD